MPVYVYRCEECGGQFEKRQSFSDEPLTECQRCRGRLRKLFQPTAIIYKGSGFYSTDHRSKSGGNGSNGTDGGNAESEPKVKPDSESKPSEVSKDSKPEQVASSK